MPLLEMLGIVKRFPGVIADDHVDFHVEQNEIHALVGENGAGKTTLMRILYGMEKPDEGMILWKGHPVSIQSPKQAIDIGIGMVHQHFQLVPSLTVAENIVLNEEPKKWIFFDKRRSEQEISSLSQHFGLKVDPSIPISELSVGVRQRIEILKLLYRNAELIILDEPTAVLTPQETRDLFSIIRNLSSEGRTIIFITHKLEEVMEVASKVTVLRRGKVVSVVKTSEASVVELARMMVGHQVTVVKRKDKSTSGKEVLTVRDLHVLDDRGLEAIRGVSLSVRSGEIVGIAGVSGNGQRELVEAIAGIRSVSNGTISIEGHSLNNLSVRRRRELGLAIIPEDRLLEGLSEQSSISENMISTRYHHPPFSSHSILQLPKIHEFSINLLEHFDIRARGIKEPVGTLSGGNQQRVVVARELATRPRFLLAAHPTRGLDIGAAGFVHEVILRFSQEGLGVLLISADLDEVLNLSNRILVFFRGRIAGVIPTSQATAEQLGLLMAGHNIAQIEGETGERRA